MDERAMVHASGVRNDKQDPHRPCWTDPSEVSIQYAKVIFSSSEDHEQSFILIKDLPSAGQKQ